MLRFQPLYIQAQRSVSHFVAFESTVVDVSRGFRRTREWDMISPKSLLLRAPPERATDLFSGCGGGTRSSLSSRSERGLVSAASIPRPLRPVTQNIHPVVMRNHKKKSRLATKTHNTVFHHVVRTRSKLTSFFASSIFGNR